MAAQYLKIQNNAIPNTKVFVVERCAVEHSGILRSLLQDMADFDTVDVAQSIIPIAIGVSDAALAKVFEWVTYWKNLPKAADDDTANNDDKAVKFGDWDVAFFDTFGWELLYEILLAANYLDIKPLYELCCLVVVNMIYRKSAEQIREILRIKNDFTPEQEAEIRIETELLVAKCPQRSAWIQESGTNKRNRFI
ncbi:Skp1 family, dimerization domain-containing protein [Parachaetomium inaequale]|uniref:Skp1 family, dimerization domain-containing protein n=1 Tax=Parachaetomium inaequale TaxID=2588326 RepID=A0AAN6PCT4_9PEZI|nr:Skp1 family, dimerization domain-containing protein [Parachaetomium inaequale]